MRARWLAGAVVFALAHEAHAYRPFDGTDADVSQFGEVELEIGPVGYLRAGHTSYVVAPGFVGNLGFLPRWELVVEAESLIQPGASNARFTDTGCFLKHVLREGTLQGKTGLSLAAEAGALLPTVNDVPGAGVYLAFIASQVWPELTVHLNLELARTGDAPTFELRAGLTWTFTAWR